MFFAISSIALKVSETMHEKIYNAWGEKNKKNEISTKINVAIIIFGCIYFLIAIIYIINFCSNLINDVISIIALFLSLCDDYICYALIFLFSWKYKVPK